MENRKLEEYYSEHSSTIFSEMLGEDENYRRLKKAKIAAEKALQSVIGNEAWKQYIALDEICNELECARYKAMYLAGAGYEVRYQDDRFPVLAAYGFPCADAEMDAEPVGVRTGAAHAVYFRLRPLYAVLPGVAAIFDLAGGRVWMLCVDFHGRFDCGCSRAF